MTVAANLSKKQFCHCKVGKSLDYLTKQSTKIPGLMKLFGDGGRLNSLVMLGDEKSSISSLKMIPVDGDMIRDPKL